MQLTVAFASSRHAREALQFLSGSSLQVTAHEQPAGDDNALAFVDVEVPRRDRARLEILVRGVHGLIIEREQATETSAG